MLFKTTPLCEQWRLTGGGTPFNLPNITWLVVWGPGQWASMPAGGRGEDVNDKFIHGKTHGQSCWSWGKGDFTALCRALQGYYRYQSAVGASRIKWLSWSFTTFCLYLIPVTHHTKTHIRSKSTFQTFGGLCNTTPVVAEAAWSASLSYF